MKPATLNSETLRQRLTEALAPELEVIQPLGKGSVASVYLARQPALKRLVAVKVLRQAAAADETTRRRFQREAEAVASISHPNVVAIHQVGRLSSGVPYLVMEHVDGKNLADLLEAEGVLSEPEAQRILSQVAGALAAAHQHGIVHRDVKPANILKASADGRIVLTDFGIAGIVATGSGPVTQLTGVGETLGDVRYMSPERIRMAPLTPAADVYSLGVLGYELLTGQDPYGTSSLPMLATAHLESAPLPLERQRPGVSEGLARLLERCLAKNPKHRPSATEVERQLGPSTTASGAELRAGRDDSVVKILPPSFQGFLDELRRRKVYTLGIAYLAVAFIVLQGMDLVLPALRLPRWSSTAVVAVVLGGFPVALALGWTFDLTRSGVRRTEATEKTGRMARIVLPTAGLLASLAMAGLIAWWILAGR